MSTRGDPTAKILIIGDSGVGKSCMLMRFSDNIYPENISTTVGIDYKAKRVKIDDCELKLTLWDTAGQEKYRALATSFYKNAMGIMVVFDLTSKITFENVRNWMRQIKKNADENVCKLLVGNKLDDEANRSVTPKEIEDLAKELGVQFIEVSAKTGENITRAFMQLSRDVKNKYFANLKPISEQKHTIALNSKNTDGNQGRKCC